MNAGGMNECQNLTSGCFKNKVRPWLEAATQRPMKCWLDRQRLGPQSWGCARKRGSNYRLGSSLARRTMQENNGLPWPEGEMEGGCGGCTANVLIVADGNGAEKAINPNAGSRPCYSRMGSPLGVGTAISSSPPIPSKPLGSRKGGRQPRPFPGFLRFFRRERAGGRASLSPEAREAPLWASGEKPARGSPSGKAARMRLCGTPAGDTAGSRTSTPERRRSRRPLPIG